MFEKVYQVYNAKDAFYWTDFLIQKIINNNNFYYTPGSSIFLNSTSFRAADLSFSTPESLEFYETHFNNGKYSMGLNTKKTYINNPESRDYLAYMGGCYFEENSITYNQLYIPHEQLSPINKLTLTTVNQNKHVETLFNIMYQIGRGLLYLFQNNSYSSKISKSLIGFFEARNFQIYKLDNALFTR